MVYVKGLVVVAKYQDVTPEVLRRVAEFLADEPQSKWVFAASLNRIASEIEAEAVQSVQAAELEALGGTEAAERGWNALRKHNPNVDKSNGSPGGEIVSFSDLSHRQKVNYAVFAAGVLDVKREPRVFRTISEIPDDVTLLVPEKQGNLMKRRGAGWWYVGRPDSPVQSGDGWPLSPEKFPVTEYVQEAN